jgi:hypothetical protein
MIGTAPALSACFATTLLLLVLVGTPCQGMGSWSVSVSNSPLVWLVWQSGDGGCRTIGVERMRVMGGWPHHQGVGGTVHPRHLSTLGQHCQVEDGPGLGGYELCWGPGLNCNLLLIRHLVVPKFSCMTCVCWSWVLSWLWGMCWQGSNVTRVAGGVLGVLHLVLLSHMLEMLRHVKLFFMWDGRSCWDC